MVSETVIRELVQKIVQEQLLVHWQTYLLMLAITLVLVMGSAFFGAYAKKRGDNFATKADFDSLLAQIKVTTAATEEIKSQISHADWAFREQKVLHRSKLEDLLQSIFELSEWQNDEKNARIYNSEKEAGRSPLPKIELLTGLYFPDLKVNVLNLCIIHRKLTLLLMSSSISLLTEAGNPSEQKKIRDQFADSWGTLYQEQLQAVSVVEQECREIMIKLI